MAWQESRGPGDPMGDLMEGLSERKSEGMESALLETLCPVRSTMCRFPACASPGLTKT